MIKNLNLISDVTSSPFQKVLEKVPSFTELPTVYNQTFRPYVEKHNHVIYILYWTLLNRGIYVIITILYAYNSTLGTHNCQPTINGNCGLMK
jgi:hypothetical protein